MSRRSGPQNGLSKESTTSTPNNSGVSKHLEGFWQLNLRIGQEKQKMLLASNTGHFSLIKYVDPVCKLVTSVLMVLQGHSTLLI